MKKQALLALISLAFLLILGSCQKTAVSTNNLYVPTAADVTSTATLAELTEGRALYVNNCASCHQLYSPDSYSATQWRSIVNNMAPKTNMNSAEVLLVTKYVTKGN